MNLQRYNSRLFAQVLLVLGLMGLVACSPSPGDSEPTTQAELAALPAQCDSLLASGADVLAVGRVADASGRYVLDTSAGRCTSSHADLISSVRRRDERGLAGALWARLRLTSNPSPHPDLGTYGVEPNPHPDVSQGGTTSSAPGGTNGDPDPHPDLSMDDDGDDDVVIIWIIIVEDDDSSDGTSAQADDSDGSLAHGGH